MARKSRHTREELQALIIDASLDMVQRRGVGHVTARRIAEAIGYTPGMLYSVFESLPEIYAHVSVITLKRLHADCVAAQAAANDPSESIHAMGLAYLAFAERHTNQFELLFRASEDDQLESLPALTERIQSLFSLIEKELAALSSTASESECQIGARALWSGVHGTAALALTGQLYLDKEHADQLIVDCLINRFLESWKA